MTGTSSIIDNEGTEIAIHYTVRKNTKIRAISRYRHVLIDVGVGGAGGPTLVTYEAHYELIGGSVLRDFRHHSGGAPRPIMDLMEGVARTDIDAAPFG